MPTPLHIAAIDAGSNAIRLAICTVSSLADIIPLVKERVPVRLGHHTFVRGELDPETLDNAITAFARFRKLFDQYGVTHYRAVSTSAVRDAKNRENLLNRLYHETGVDLEVIDGEEEARLVRRAVLGAFPPGVFPDVIADLGGGSLEITRRANEQWQTASMRIGTVRLMETFGLDGAISTDEGTMMRRYIGSLLRPALPPEQLEGSRLTAACGGNAEELARLFGSLDEDLGLPQISATELENALPKLLKYDVDKRMDKFDIRRDRAEVIGIAGLVFASMMEELGIERLVVPQVGIREGLLIELAEAHFSDAPPSAGAREMAVAASARAFAARIGHDTTHGEQVRHLARTMFDQLADIHGLPSNRRVALELAGLLHDIGEVVHRKGHHKHGEYLVLNGRIPGLESPEREIVAALVRAHRKSSPDPKKHPTYGSLTEKQQVQVRKLSAILRIADAIDTDHRQRVVDLRTEVRGAKIIFHVTLENDVSETKHLAHRKVEAFESEFDYEVFFEIEVIPTALHFTDSRAK